MATKLIIGKSAPQSFPLKVIVPTSGGEREINFTAKHIPSTTLAKLRESHAEVIGESVNYLFNAARAEAEKAYADTKPKKATDEEKEAAIAGLTKRVKDSEIAALRARNSGEIISKITESWDLDAPFSQDALIDMCDTYPGADEAIFKAYNETREGLAQKN